MATKDSLPRTPSEKLAQAIQLKERGTQHFKNEEWREAAKYYHHALMYTKGVSSGLPNDPFMKMVAPEISNSHLEPQESEKLEAIQLTITLSNNIAVCMLKLCQWEKVIKHCTTVLEHDNSNIKALYRRGVAYLNLDRLDESEADLKMALQIDPNDSSVRKQYVNLQERLKLYWNNEKKKYQKLFES